MRTPMRIRRMVWKQLITTGMITGYGNDHYNQCKKTFKTGNLRQLLIRSIKPPVFQLTCYIIL